MQIIQSFRTSPSPSKISIKKDRTLTKEKILELLIDVTEHPIQRPKKKKQTGKRTPKDKQMKYYSGKKKRPPVKEIAISETGKIVSLSKIIPGRKHYFRIRKEGDKLPNSGKTIVESGYQGLQKIRTNVLLPFKSTKIL